MKDWKKIDSFTEYSSLIAEKRNVFLHNNGFFPQQMRTYAEAGRMRALVRPTFLCVFLEEDDYEQLVFYVSPDAAVTEADVRAFGAACVRDVVCSLVYAQKEAVLPDNALTNAIQAFGLCRTFHNFEYQMQLPAVAYPPLADERFELRHAGAREFAEILVLWKNALPRFMTERKTDSEWERILHDGRVLAVYTPQGVLCGASYFDVVLGRSTEHHIVTAPAWRGCGVADVLLAGWKYEAVQRGAKTCVCWIEENNIASIKRHRKHGAVLTGREAWQYTRRAKSNMCSKK